MFESVFAMCLIKDVYNDRRYIAAQGPIDESVTDFLRMIWEFQITSVVCTANDIEAGRVNHEWVFINESIAFLFFVFQFKFRRYWPDDERFLQFGCYRISKVHCIVSYSSLLNTKFFFLKDETSDKGFTCEDYEIRPLVITQGENRRHIVLYHILHWWDHDIPNNEAPILELLSRLDTERSLLPETPILVHCR